MDSFSFLNDIPGQKGYIVISNGSIIIKSDGELENNESLAMNVQKMLSVGEPLAHTVGKIEKMTIAYPEHSIEVVRSGKYVFIVKKKNS
ncbi:Ragulator complex protein [Dirofilaria immitis]